MLFVGIQCAALAVLLASCSSGLPVRRDVSEAEEYTRPSSYSFVFVIHGDGDYLYHDPEGLERRADEKVLLDVIRVAERNPGAEVFIFHQRPARRFLFLFPLPDGDFYYYRGGVLITRESYGRGQAGTGLTPEVRLFRKFKPSYREGQRRMFLYFGHDIPEVEGKGYDASYPDREFTVQDMSEGLQGFSSDGPRFDLIVLSTCYGGTPFTIEAVGRYARHIIASPVNLHLSYFDVGLLERTDIGGSDEDMSSFAKRFAREAFDRLSRDVHTEVSVVVYDVDRVQEYLHAIRGDYRRVLSSWTREAQASDGEGERCDCADIRTAADSMMNQGVTVFFSPARFGRSAMKQGHSGWGCRREDVSGDRTSRRRRWFPE